MIKLAERVLSISPSPTLSITSRAKEMRERGIDVISFGAGEPDFDTPEHIKEAAKDAIDMGFTKYVPSAGISELRAAIVSKLKRDNNIDYDLENVVVTDGAKHALFNIMLSILEAGDEVIIPSPYWVTYPEQVKFAGGIPVFVETKEEEGFIPNVEDIEDKISSRTKAIILCSPNNPTGAVIGKERLEEIGNLCYEKGILIISDECYEKIVYDGEKHVSIASISEKLKGITVTVNALSKTYSMTGWRVGYAAGPKDLISAIVKLNSQSISNVNSIAQKAAVKALEGPQDFLTEWISEFDRRRKYIVTELNTIPGIKCSMPKGAFYVFPNVKELMKMAGFEDDKSFAEFVLEEAEIAVVPGSAFGLPGYFRLSYATSFENIEEGISRLRKFAERFI